MTELKRETNIHIAVGDFNTRHKEEPCRRPEQHCLPGCSN